jgi:hypothetical protein
MITTYYQLIEDSIKELGLNPEDVRGKQEGQWNLKKGRFDIMMDVWEQENIHLFQIVAPLCSLPADNKEEFLMHLLQKNYGLNSVAYSIMEDTVFLKFTSEANTLSKPMILALLNKIAFYCEQSTFVPDEVA